MKTNKEVIDKLQKYFLTQDILLVTRGYANAIIDLNRFMNFDELSDEEQSRLLERIEFNMAEVVKLIENNDTSDLHLFKWEK